MSLGAAWGGLVTTGPMRMGERADALHITPGTAARNVDCLVDKGLVERVKAVDDLRSILVSVTDEGQRRHDVLAERIGKGLDEILGEFDADEHEQLAELLERFVGAVDRYVTDQDQRT